MMNVIVILMGIALNLLIDFGGIAIFTMLIFDFVSCHFAEVVYGV
jgi:hypothetical protein